MPFTSGTLSATAYRTGTPCPSDARERFKRSLHRHAFKPIDAEKGETQSIGWADPRNILSPSLSWDHLTVGPYLFLGLRVDRKTIPSMLLKARVREALRELAKEKKVQRISRTEKKAVEERIAGELLRQASPSVAVCEAVWNTASGEVFFAASSRGVNEAFVELFAQTFDIELLPNHPLARATEIASAVGHPEGLSELRPSFWGVGPRIAAVHDVQSVGEEGN